MAVAIGRRHPIYWLALSYVLMVSDFSGVRSLMVRIEDPFGFINVYPATLATPNRPTSAWAFTLEAGQKLFAIPGGYKVVLITTDSLGNTQASQPYKVYTRSRD